jgi:hypothetical protein
MDLLHFKSWQREWRVYITNFASKLYMAHYHSSRFQNWLEAIARYEQYIIEAPNPYPIDHAFLVPWEKR